MADPQNGLWLLPSRRRPKNLMRFCHALKKTGTSTPGVILLEISDYADRYTEYDEVELPEGWRFIALEGDSQGDKIRQFFAKETWEWESGDWFGLIGDDQVVITEQWDLKLIEGLKGWNLVSCDDGGWQSKERGGRIAGTMLWSGDLARAVGYLFPPNLHHVYLDDIWEELGRETGCWKFERDARLDVLIEHHHYTRGMSEKDDTYSRAYDHFASTDYPPWTQWRSNEKDHAAARIRELMRQCGAS